MDEQEYLQARVDDQIRWLSDTSGINQRRFKWLRLAEIVLASLVPVVAAMSLSDAATRALTAAFGAAAAIIAGAVSLWKYQELWAQYRATAEALKREKFLYLTRTASYGGADRFARLVERVEQLLGGDVDRWLSLTAPVADTGKTS